MYRKHHYPDFSPSFVRLVSSVLAAAVLGGTSFFVIHDWKSQKDYQQWARIQNKEVYDQSLTQRTMERMALKESQKENDSFYQRLHDHLPVRILILGDAYGQGLGAENKRSVWYSLLENSLRKKYKVNITIDNLALGGTSGAYSGFGILSSLKNASQGGKDYDLCVLIYGSCDTPKEFNLWYEAILQNLREKYPRCSVMSLLGHQGAMMPELGYLDENTSSLKNLTKAYHGALIDMPSILKPEDSAKGKETGKEYTNDGLFLNNAGQKLLADTIFDTITKTVSKYPDYDAAAVQAISPELPALKKPVYIRADQFTRIDQYTLTIGPSALKEAGIDVTSFTGTLGVDLNYIPGANDLLVSDAGRGIGRNTIRNDEEKPERAIVAINDHVRIEHYLMLTFLTKSQADDFRGMLFTGDVPMPDMLDAFTTPEQIGPTNDAGELIPLDKEGRLPSGDDGATPGTLSPDGTANGVANGDENSSENGATNAAEKANASNGSPASQGQPAQANANANTQNSKKQGAQIQVSSTQSVSAKQNPNAVNETLARSMDNTSTGATAESGMAAEVKKLQAEAAKAQSSETAGNTGSTGNNSGGNPNSTRSATPISSHIAVESNGHVPETLGYAMSRSNGEPLPVSEEHSPASLIAERSKNESSEATSVHTESGTSENTAPTGSQSTGDGAKSTEDVAKETGESVKATDAAYLVLG